MKKLFYLLTIFTVTGAFAQNTMSYWQQHVDYDMDVEMNVETFEYSGNQELVYTNNSPDTLNQVFYHLYFNAFQPGSAMDVRSRTIADPDSRVGSRISELSPDEIGYLKVQSLTRDGEPLEYEVEGTVLEVELDEPILPGESTTFNMEFLGQVPLQIRRSGRNNEEGIALSMTQWYPKMAEYDFEGWHADPYIGREFHGVWGDFDVKITIDKDYILGATGTLQNANEIGYNYQDEGVEVDHAGKDELTWHFKAEKVHDFAWAADPDYIHDKRVAADGTVLHFLYQEDPEIIENWEKLQPETEELLMFFNEHIGPYPWPQYTVIQGGDGGMEYAMLTLITGERSFGSLLGVTAHEMAHAWFQHLMATNESRHEWMDEGFTSYISSLAVNYVTEVEEEFPHSGSYRSYNRLADSGIEQPQTTHADRYVYNAAYGASAYSKGAVFLAQLGYIIGEENLEKTLNRYYDVWKFKHPTPNDFIRIAEKVSGAELDWYLNDWTRTVNQIDYAIKSVEEDSGNTSIVLERLGVMPMPVEVNVSLKDGTERLYYIPLNIMRWEKPAADPENTVTMEDWGWAFPTYDFIIETPLSEIEKIEIDDSRLMADVDRENNIYPRPAPAAPVQN